MQSPEPQHLLQRILRSRYFAGDEEASRLLIAVAGADSAPAAQQDLDSVRERLREFFRGEGASEPLRATIPKDHARLYFFEPAAKGFSALDTLWSTYFADGARNRLVHGESGGLVHLEEMYAALRLVAWFQEKDGSLSVGPAEETVESFPGINLILTGTSESNRAIRHLLDADDEAYRVRRLTADSRHGVITLVRDLTAARAVTDEETVRELLAPFEDGLPPDFGWKF